MAMLAENAFASLVKSKTSISHQTPAGESIPSTVVWPVAKTPLGMESNSISEVFSNIYRHARGRTDAAPHHHTLQGLYCRISQEII